MFCIFRRFRVIPDFSFSESQRCLCFLALSKALVSENNVHCTESDVRRNYAKHTGHIKVAGKSLLLLQRWPRNPPYWSLNHEQCVSLPTNFTCKETEAQDRLSHLAKGMKQTSLWNQDWNPGHVPSLTPSNVLFSTLHQLQQQDNREALVLLTTQICSREFSLKGEKWKRQRMSS